MNLKEAKQILRANGYILEEGIVDKIKARFSKTPDIAKMNLKADDDYDSDGDEYDSGAKEWIDKIGEVIRKTGFKISGNGKIYNKHSTCVGGILLRAGESIKKYGAAEIWWRYDLTEQRPNAVCSYDGPNAMSADQVIKAWNRDLDELTDAE